MKLFGSLGFALGASCLSITAPPRSCEATEAWPGFHNIKHVFSFGNSYTTTDFNPRGEQPSRSNPMGNHGYTSSNGPNWVDYLTAKYNQSLLLSYNLAVGGATIDPHLVPGGLPPKFCLRGQVHESFIPNYAQDDAQAGGGPPWRPADSLFAVWMGINDMLHYYQNGPGGTAATNRRAMDEYAQLMATLHGRGGRNFVFVNMPALDRSPEMGQRGPGHAPLMREDVRAFNRMLVRMAQRFKARFPGANVWVHDAYADFSSVMDDPGCHPETSGYKNVTDWCPPYGLSVDHPDMFIPECGVPANEYFWLNSFHPTDPIHAVVAKQIAKGLSNGPNICSGGFAADDEL